MDIDTETQEEIDKDFISLFRKFAKLNLLEIEMTREELKTSFIETITSKLKEIEQKFLFEDLENLKEMSVYVEFT